MTKEDLLKTAKKLEQPQNECAWEYTEKRDALAAAVIDVMRERPDLIKLIGEGNQSMMEDNARNMARFMESVFVEYNPQMLVETVLWVFRAYRSHGFNLSFWPAHLDVWIEVIRKDLSEDTFNALYPFFNWIQINIPAFVSLTDDLVEKN